MELTRDGFVEQFAISFQVHCLKHWPKRRNEAPTFLTACLLEWIKTNGGQSTRKGAVFAELARPVIEEVHRVTPKGERPDASRLAGLLYDALERAGAEITLRKLEMVTAAR